MLFQEAQPVFADIDPRNLNICPQRVEDALKKDKKRKIKALVAVDVFGHPAEWDALYGIAKRYGLRIIEDSCDRWLDGVLIVEPPSHEHAEGLLQKR